MNFIPNDIIPNEIIPNETDPDEGVEVYKVMAWCDTLWQLRIPEQNGHQDFGR